MKTYRPYSPRQSQLLPASPLEWLPEGHLAFLVLDVVEQLDLRPVFAHYEREERGYPPHHPQMMMALLLYGYCVGVRSSRQVERRTHEDVAFRVIAGGTHPDHSSIARFRTTHQAVFEKLFVQVLRLCQKAGLVRLGHVALDGTKMKANASKHKAMSYERMQKREAELSDTVKAILAEAELVDAEEDAKYGKERRGDELPEELRRAESRLERIRAAKAELEAEAKAAQEAEDAGQDEPPPGGKTELPVHRVRHDAEGKPASKAQRNFTDAESRIQKTNDGFVQGYNAQIAVDEGNQIIVAQALTNQPPDVEHFEPMLARVVENCGEAPKRTTADAGYFSERNVAAAEALGTEAFIATDRKRHGDVPERPRGRVPDGLTVRERMARKLLTARGAASYARRKAVVEPVFGQVKQARGIRQFLMRGLVKAQAEWALVCATHNLLKLHRGQVA